MKPILRTLSLGLFLLMYGMIFALESGEYVGIQRVTGVPLFSRGDNFKCFVIEREKIGKEIIREDHDRHGVVLSDSIVRYCDGEKLLGRRVSERRLIKVAWKDGNCFSNPTIVTIEGVLFEGEKEYPGYKVVRHPRTLKLPVKVCSALCFMMGAYLLPIGCSMLWKYCQDSGSL